MTTQREPQLRRWLAWWVAEPNFVFACWVQAWGGQECRGVGVSARKLPASAAATAPWEWGTWGASGWGTSSSCWPWGRGLAGSVGLALAPSPLCHSAADSARHVSRRHLRPRGPRVSPRHTRTRAPAHACGAGQTDSQPNPSPHSLSVPPRSLYPHTPVLITLPDPHIREPHALLWRLLGRVFPTLPPPHTSVVPVSAPSAQPVLAPRPL